MPGLPFLTQKEQSEYSVDCFPLTVAALMVSRSNRVHQRFETARPARRHAHPLDHRVRPDAFDSGIKGRDHNPFVFTNWLCGGGIKGGTTHGLSDQWGYKPLDREHPTEVYDIHATILHLLGIYHSQLTVRHNGIDRRLTDVHGHVIDEVVT